MLTTETIKQVATDNPSVYAFHIEGGVTSSDLAAVADVLNNAFDRHGKINMLLLLHGYSPSDSLRSFSLKSLATQLRSISHIERYAVVGAPSPADSMLSALDKVSSIEVRSFEPGEEDAAWSFVGARPVAQ